MHFGGVSDVANHLQGIQKIQERKFTHVIFDAKPTNMPGAEFVTKVLELDEDIIAIPASSEPTIDDVFNLLTLGANGFLVKPFTLEDALVMATKGEPISDAILYAKDRNEALVSLELTALDNFMIVRRQSEQFETARRELPRTWKHFQRAAEIAKMFAEGGEEQLVERLVEFCVQRAEGPASRLGRVRERMMGRRRKKALEARRKREGEQEAGVVAPTKS
jgi:DNA-binding NarL/FixJ family response regulator